MRPLSVVMDPAPQRRRTIRIAATTTATSTAITTTTQIHSTGPSIAGPLHRGRPSGGSCHTLPLAQRRRVRRTIAASSTSTTSSTSSRTTNASTGSPSILAPLQLPPPAGGVAVRVSCAVRAGATHGRGSTAALRAGSRAPAPRDLPADPCRPGGCHPGPSGVKGAAVLASLRSSRPCGSALRAPLDPARPGVARRQRQSRVGLSPSGNARPARHHPD
jgi:hypothetical protein